MLSANYLASFHLHKPVEDMSVRAVANKDRSLLASSDSHRNGGGLQRTCVNPFVVRSVLFLVLVLSRRSI